MEHPQSVLLSKVQESNLALQHNNASSNHMDVLQRWMDLQRSVNVLYDSSKGLGKIVSNNVPPKSTLYIHPLPSPLKDPLLYFSFLSSSVFYVSSSILIFVCIYLSYSQMYFTNFSFAKSVAELVKWFK